MVYYTPTTGSYGELPNWRVQVFADKDILTGAGPANNSTDKAYVMDPRLATMRWWAWRDNASQAGVAPATWVMKGETQPRFNTLPLINTNCSESDKYQALRNILSGFPMTPRVDSMFGAECPEWPSGGNEYATEEVVYYNKANFTDPITSITYPGRENATATNGIALTKNEIGTAFVSPSNSLKYTQEWLHFQFAVVYPLSGVVPTTAAKNCVLTLVFASTKTAGE